MKLYLLISVLSVLPFCNIQSADIPKAIIPKGAVPFGYDFKMKRMILIPGTLNDSKPFKYWLETGVFTMTFSDTLASKVEKRKAQNGFCKVQKKMKVRIGRWGQVYGGSVHACYLNKNNRVFGVTGANVGIMPWQFFDKKIIEISYSKQYIRELSNTANLQGYDSIKMKVSNGLLGIPVEIVVQGKKIQELVFIDTGSNGDFSFSNEMIAKYAIKSDSAYFGKSIRIDGFQHGFSLISDSIQIGKSTLTEKCYIAFLMDNRHMPSPFNGHIGNGVLERFDVVLDLKKYDLYLKLR